MKQFDHDYRRLVLPQLARMVRVHGYTVQLEMEMWSEAWDAVWGFARSRGALHLSHNLPRELAYWIECELLAAIERAPDIGVLTREQLDRLPS